MSFWDLRAQCGKPDCVLVPLYLREATYEASQGSCLKGAVLAQKALQGSETEKRELVGGTEENSFFTAKGIDLFDL